MTSRFDVIVYDPHKPRRALGVTVSTLEEAETIAKRFRDPLHVDVHEIETLSLEDATAELARFFA